MEQRWRRRGLNLALGLGLVLAVWPSLGPSQLGGPATYAVVAGSSMAPALRTGDLVVLRPARKYAVGQVVGYRTASGALVLHRIVGRMGEGYLFQGDNNSWIDPYLPAGIHLIGRLRHRIPGVGRVIVWLRTPLPSALVVGLVAFSIAVRHGLRSEEWGHKNRPRLWSRR
jgi:signal peptidase I